MRTLIVRLLAAAGGYALARLAIELGYVAYDRGYDDGWDKGVLEGLERARVNHLAEATDAQA